MRAAPDVAAPLRKEKTTGTGDYLAGAPTNSAAKTAWGLPVLVSSHIPAGRCIVADASRIFIGRRRDVRVTVSDQARFADDVVGFKITARYAGLHVVEATSVQVITPAA